MEELTYDLDSLYQPSYDTMWYGDFSSMMGMSSTSSYVLSCALLVWSIICLWRMFQKAWLPGWGSIIPFYNIYLRLKMAGRSGRWLLSLLFLPLFAIISIITYFDIAKRFGKHRSFGLGLWFLSPIFMGILAFDKSTYSAI